CRRRGHCCFMHWRGSSGPAESKNIRRWEDEMNLREQLKRYGTVYLALWRNSVTREMTFKSNFLMWIVVEMLWFGLQLSFIGVIYLHTDHIGDWTKWQVIMLVGASHFIQQIFQAFFLVN